MTKKILLTTILLFAIKTSSAQIPIDEYKTEISNLKTEKELEAYWSKLQKIDQEILVKTDDIRKADSISIDNMIRTALILKIHGEKVYKPNNIVPILNMTHNYIGNCQNAFWPIIETCAKIGGIIDNFGGKYPAYQIDGVALTFYGYSLYGQESKYPELIKKMSALKKGSVVSNLLEAFKYQTKLHNLTEIEVLNRWQLQPFHNKKEEGVFEFVKMSDDFIYLRKHKHIQKLILTKTKGNSKIFRIENEPFGWSYIYGEDGSLSLIDNEENELINYTLAK
ncbi:MAG: hypothetical protein HRT68_13685 [Flavobacteriaceae bacterium]|nr:hypothetical protein [Flavobacteriaceae bacterium]